MKNYIMYSKMYYNYFTNLFTTEDITAKDIDLILYCTRRQDEFGVCTNIYYKEIQKSLHIKSRQTFHNILDRLQQLNLIEYKHIRYARYSIRLINNSPIEHIENSSYIDINKDFLYSNEFIALRKNSKLLCLYLLYQPTIQQKKNFNVKIGTIANVLGVQTLNIVKTYLDEISPFFTCYTGNLENKKTLKERVVKITADKKIEIRTKKTNNSRYVFLRHILIELFQKNKITYTKTNIKDIIILCNQYKYCFTGRYRTFIKIIEKTIKQHNAVIPKLINKTLQYI